MSARPSSSELACSTVLNAACWAVFVFCILAVVQAWRTSTTRLFACYKYVSIHLLHSMITPNACFLYAQRGWECSTYIWQRWSCRHCYILLVLLVRKHVLLSQSISFHNLKSSADIPWRPSDGSKADASATGVAAPVASNAARLIAVESFMLTSGLVCSAQVWQLCRIC